MQIVITSRCLESSRWLHVTFLYLDLRMWYRFSPLEANEIRSIHVHFFTDAMNYDPLKCRKQHSSLSVCSLSEPAKILNAAHVSLVLSRNTTYANNVYEAKVATAFNKRQQRHWHQTGKTFTGNAKKPPSCGFFCSAPVLTGYSR